MAERIGDDDIKAAWDDVQIPRGFVELYGEPKIWDFDGNLSRQVYFQNTLIDQLAVWLFAEIAPSVYTGIGLLISPRSDVPLQLTFQAALDRWRELSHPFREGDILPTPRQILMRKDEQGRFEIPSQSGILSHTVHEVDGDFALVHFYDRTRYRIERVTDMCDESQEAFRLVRI